MEKIISRFILRILGWKTMNPPASENKCIILGAPHTSQWDFVISFLYYKAVGGKAFVMIKKEAFWGPLGPIVRAMGGIPVDRTKGASTAKQIIDAFNNSEKMHLAISPEGSRKATKKWKHGFHTIARAANVPVYTGYYDWGKKEVGLGDKMELTDDPKEDIKKIKAWYRDKGVVGKYPKNFILEDLD